MRLTRWIPRFAAVGCAAAVGAMTSPGSALGQNPAPATVSPAPAAPQPLPGGTATELLTSAEAPKTPPAPPPYGGPLLERTTLTGDWLGARDAMRDNGLTWDISSTNFYQGVRSGGLERGNAFGGRGDILLNVNGEKAGLWQGLFVDLHAETLYGQSVNGSTGALMPVNTAMLFPNPNAPQTALTGVKITQALSETFVVFAGKINTLDGFNQPFTGGARGTNGFMNVALLAPTVALRTVPYSTFGAGFAVLKDMEPVVSVMVLDPNNTPTVSGFNTFFDRGVTVFGMANLPTKLLDRPGHQGVGFTYSNSRYASLDDLPFFVAGRLRGEFPPLPKETGSWSLFYMFDQTLWASCDDPKRSWGVFGNAGISDGNPNPVRWTANVGVGGSSPFACRKLDSFGVGYYYLGVSDDLKKLAPRLVPVGDENGVELFYNVGVTPWCHVTPDLQVVNPLRSRVDTSVTFALRAKIDF